MITVTLTSKGAVQTASAEFNGETISVSHTRNSPIPMLARKLSRVGAPDASLLWVVRDTIPVFKTPLTLGPASAISISDNDKTGIRRKRYEAMDDGLFREAAE
jgi:hypothetical protein